MIKEIKHEDLLLALIIKSGYSKKGIEFFTPPDFSQQLAYMSYNKGHTIDSHVHKKVRREVLTTNEVLILKKGKLRVDFYSNEWEYIKSEMLEQGDIILLVSGGHGFKVIEDVEMVEVKQGPYAMGDDKVRFDCVDDSDVRFE